VGTTTKVTRLTCASGKRAIAGGAYAGTGVLVGTYPDLNRDTDWLAEFRMTTASYSVRAYVICVDRQ
jgi:hypothetical protein